MSQRLKNESNLYHGGLREITQVHARCQYNWHYLAPVELTLQFCSCSIRLYSNCLVWMAQSFELGWPLWARRWVWRIYGHLNINTRISIFQVCQRTLFDSYSSLWNGLWKKKRVLKVYKLLICLLADRYILSISVFRSSNHSFEHFSYNCIEKILRFGNLRRIRFIPARSDLSIPNHLHAMFWEISGATKR